MDTQTNTLENYKQQPPVTSGYMRVIPKPNATCPNCGYCPHCGRGGTVWPVPYAPWIYPQITYTCAGPIATN